MAAIKKDYEVIAAALNEAILEHHDDNRVAIACSRIARHLVLHFSSNNPRFDRQRFLKACGIL